ncbi:hypothetical protein LH23_23425 [Cedecea neteri]|uniref:Putative tail fiber protein gp53-like C-terminal domain-containing protein n=1 Tax=Cedecea neteri TaxID=158822 RepID=A0AAN0SAP4_9ENTR|nr:hypothetical protein [Cedecea neteri]AIR63510.1 hypothetical protein LH23_23425 [Cedecea neteri]
MATNQFKPFATRPDANVTPQNEWENLPALLSGFAGGKASSAQVNKALRQTSFIAAALAQFVSDKSGQDVLDDGDIAAFLAKLTTGFGKQYLSRQNPFADIKADGAAAISSALSNLGLGDGSASLSTNGWQKLSSGLILQWGYNVVANGVVSVTFPIPFPTSFFCISGNHGFLNTTAGPAIVVKTSAGMDRNKVTLLVTNSFATINTVDGWGCFWIALGC